MTELVWQNARRQAQNLLNEYWDGHSYPIPVLGISQNLGIQTFIAPLGEYSGMIIKQPGKQAHAYADIDESSQRQRFTFAHELGHYVERTRVANDNEFSFEDHRSLEKILRKILFCSGLIVAGLTIIYTFVIIGVSISQKASPIFGSTTAVALVGQSLGLIAIIAKYLFPAHGVPRSRYHTVPLARSVNDQTLE